MIDLTVQFCNIGTQRARYWPRRSVQRVSARANPQATQSDIQSIQGIKNLSLLTCFKVNTMYFIKLTDDQLLYPSSSSYYVEDHLQMFEFAGKLIGKAVYESQVVNAEFAPFFLRHLIGFRNQNYSFLDDLVTLDQELYKNLNSIKREENVSDLELTFTYSESHLGKLITEELLPSGEFIKVTNENKYDYISLQMACFLFYNQIELNIFIWWLISSCTSRSKIKYTRSMKDSNLWCHRNGSTCSLLTRFNISSPALFTISI